MRNFTPSPLLRQALLADSVTSGACGLLMLIGAGLLAHLGLPESLLRVAGGVLLPYAALVAWLGTRETVSRVAVWAVILGNVVWAADSLLLLLGHFVEPTRAGSVFVILQALAVGMYAALQLIGLRRSEATA
jgi:hypothetical protein